MTTNEKALLELLVAVNALERRCKTLHASTAVPPSVYELLGKLRDELARWGTECIVEERRVLSTPDYPEKQSGR
jgi:hypothetical protein